MLGGVVHFGLVTILAMDSGFSFLVHMLSRNLLQLDFSVFLTLVKQLLLIYSHLNKKRSYCKYPSILLINAALLVNTIRENLLEREKVSINSYFFLFGGKIWQKLGRMIKFL